MLVSHNTQIESGDLMRGFRWLWPSIASAGDAENAARIGAGAALVIAVIPTALSVAALISKRPQYGIDGWGLIDAGLFALIFWEVRNYSFIWAIVGFALYLVEILWGIVSLAHGAVGLVTVFVVLAFVGGVRGTYFLRRLNSKQTESV